MPKVRKRAAGSLVQPVSDKTLADWNAIHRTYAARNYQLKDSWELVSYYDYSVTGNENSLEELQNMKIQILGDSILIWMGRKSRFAVRTAIRLCTNGMHLTTPIWRTTLLFVVSIYPSQSLFCLYSRRRTRYTAICWSIFILVSTLCCIIITLLVFQIRKKIGAGTAFPWCKLEYTQADMYKDVKKEMSSKRAREYNIRPYKGELKSYWGDRVSLANSSGGFYFVKLPNYKSFPILLLITATRTMSSLYIPTRMEW